MTSKVEGRVWQDWRPWTAPWAGWITNQVSCSNLERRFRFCFDDLNQILDVICCYLFVQCVLLWELTVFVQGKALGPGLAQCKNCCRIFKNIYHGRKFKTSRPLEKQTAHLHSHYYAFWKAHWHFILCKASSGNTGKNQPGFLELQETCDHDYSIIRFDQTFCILSYWYVSYCWFWCWTTHQFWSLNYFIQNLLRPKIWGCTSQSLHHESNLGLQTADLTSLPKVCFVQVSGVSSSGPKNGIWVVVTMHSAQTPLCKMQSWPAPVVTATKHCKLSESKNQKQDKSQCQVFITKH